MRSPILPLLNEQQIRLDLDARDATEAIRAVAALLHGNPAVIDARQLCEDVIAREQVNTTALSHGFALPHARTKAVSDIVLAVGRSHAGVSFGSGPAPVRLIFLLGTPPQMISQYLGVVGGLARLLKDDAVRQCLLDAESPEEFIAALG